MSDAPDELAAAEIAEIRASLLAFYETRRRELPWRRDVDPYRVWVSEIMLQQTRVEAVVPYYERWLERFPTVDALADADTDDVLKQWEGLGYYSRARNLHRAARIVRDRHAGKVPGGYDALRTLPGVGEYTAGAIASIAFGQSVPAVDGNVRRVLCRLLDAEELAPATLRRLAASLVPPDRPGDFNQALMELGATVCTPRAPSCHACPLHNLCAARAAGTAALRPAPRPKRTLPECDVATAVLVAPSGRVLLVRRPERGLLAGLWECPGVAVSGEEAAADAAAKAGEEALARAAALSEDAAAAPTTRGGDARRALGSIVHTFTHLRTTYHAFGFEVAEETGSGPGGAGRDVAWVDPERLDGHTVPVAQQKVLALLKGRGAGG